MVHSIDRRTFAKAGAVAAASLASQRANDLLHYEYRQPWSLD